MAFGTASAGLKENKFGIPMDRAFSLYQEAATLSNVHIIGVDCHIGSQLMELTPFMDALDRLLVLVDQLSEQGIDIQHLDLGGGLGVRYRDEQPPEPSEYAAAILEKLQGRSLEIILEPGRAIAGNAGILVTRVEYIKSNPDKNFAVVDAAMNDLLRPALYDAWHDIIPVHPRSSGEAQHFDIVGPVCESGDFLAKDRELILQENDLLAVRTAGAYGFTMSSNYNSRPRAAELLVDGKEVHLVRARESVEQLYADESVLPR